MLSARLFRLLGPLFSEIIPFFCVHSHQVQMRANSFWVYTELAECSPRELGITLIIGSLESKSLKCTN